MPNVQTQVSREQLAELHKEAILGGKSLKDLLNQIITKHLKEDVSWQKMNQQNPSKDLENS
jgi:hypothetical protein